MFDQDKRESRFFLALLAAGQSGRMQSPKALLMFDRKRTFLEKILQEYFKAGCNLAVVVVNHQNVSSVKKIIESNFGNSVKIIENANLYYERFYSIKLAISLVELFDLCFIHDVDHPFINSKLIKNMSKYNFDGDYLVPVYKESKGHPVLLKNNVLQYIRKHDIYNDNFRLILKNFTESRFDTDTDDILKNINTLEDYKRYFT